MGFSSTHGPRCSPSEWHLATRGCYRPRRHLGSEKALPKEGYSLHVFNLLSTHNDSSHNLSPLLDSDGLLHFYGGRGRVKQFDAPGRGGIEHFR